MLRLRLPAGSFVIAWTDSTTRTVNVLTSRPGSGFGPAAAFTPATLGDVAIAPGHAALSFGSAPSAPMTITGEAIS